MKHIQLRALTLTFTLLMAAFAAQHASARPNWPDYTDGENIYVFEDWAPHNECTLVCNESKYYIKLVREDGETYTVAQNTGDYFGLPAGVAAGDRVFRTQMSFVFVNKSGKAYYSVNVTDRSLYRDDINEAFKSEKLLLVDGLYQSPNGRQLTIEARNRVLTIGEGVEEVISEVKDYTHEGITYMEITTGNSRYYIHPTAEGIDVYQMAKPKQPRSKKGRARTTLKRIMSLRFALSSQFADANSRFPMLSYGIVPLVQNVRKYYPNELVKVLAGEMNKQDKDQMMKKIAATL